MNDENLNSPVDINDINKLADIDITYDNKIESLRKELSDCFEIDSNMLEEENIKTISRLHLWLSRLAVESIILKKAQRKRQLIYSSLHEEFRTGQRGQITLTDKGIDTWIQKNSQYQKYNSIYEYQQVVVDYIKDICWALKNTKMTALKNINDIKRYELG